MAPGPPPPSAADGGVPPVVRRRPKMPRPMSSAWGQSLPSTLFLAFGGSQVTLAKGGGSGAVAERVGPEAVARMADHWAIGHKVRVPLAWKWTALMLLWQGHSTAEVARTIRASDATVRRWKKGVEE